MAFQGSLAELHLPDIIQLISVSGKSGVFHLIDGSHRGQIYLHEGKIVHAELEDVSGEEAVYALAIWSQGDFRFDPGAVTQLRTISKSNTNLLMEAARRLDEWRVLSKKIPSTELVPEFVVQDNREGQINLNTSEWLILSKIDGRRSIKGIAAACGLSVFDAAKILYGLIATGLIRLRDAGPPGPAPRPAARAAAAAPGHEATHAPTLAAAVSAELLTRLGRVREVCISQLGAVGESVVNKHYQKARAELERGAGSEAVDEAIAQIARAASILKGPAITEMLLEQLKSIR
jgi:Domain of unknown function (DUF4388)